MKTNNMKIGKITLKNKFILAPMAGYTTPAMRRLAAENGAGLTVTEMVSVKGLLYNSQKTKELLKTHPAEEVTCVQLFGYQPDDFYRCALKSELNGFDIIDVNMGCPVPKVVKNGEGSALIQDKARAADIISALKSAGKTVTAKTRLSETEDKTVEFLQALFDAGADMVALHARTPQQMYRGTADYQMFKRIKNKINMPLALSGDIVDTDSLKKAEDTGADLFLIGRGAIINPAIFLLFSGELSKDDTQQKTLKHSLAFKLFDYMCQDEGEDMAVKSFRKFVPYVLKGEKCPKDIRHGINFITDANILKQTLKNILTDY